MISVWWIILKKCFEVVTFFDSCFPLPRLPDDVEPALITGTGRTLICLDSMRVLTVPRPNLHFFHQVAMSWGRRNNENVEIMIHPDYQYFLDATRRKVGRTSHNIMKREYVWRHDYFIFILRHLSGISSSSSMASQRAFRVVSITTIARNNPIYPKYYAYSRVLSAM